MKADLLDRRSDCDMPQKPLTKEVIRKWLLSRTITRLPLPDLDGLRTDIESYAKDSLYIDAIPFGLIVSRKE